MKALEFRKLIREEVKRVLNEHFEDLRQDTNDELLDAFKDAADALMEDLYELGGYHDNQHLKDYLKHIIDTELK